MTGQVLFYHFSCKRQCRTGQREEGHIPVFRRIFLIATLSCSATAGAGLRIATDSLLFPGIDFTATMALSAGEYHTALRELHAVQNITDSTFHLFKLGLALDGTGDSLAALDILRSVSRQKSLVAPFAFEKIGDIEYRMGRHRNAISAWRTASQEYSSQRYQYYIYYKIQDVAVRHADSIGVLPWLDELLRKLPPRIPVDTTDLRIREILSRPARPALDSLLGRLWADKLPTTCCAPCTLLTPRNLPDSLLSTRQVYSLALNAFHCSRHELASDWLLRAVDRPDFTAAVNQSEYLLFRGELNYRLRNYKNAITWFKKYLETGKPTPTLVYLMARSYRATGQNALANDWYDKHLTLFPDDPKTIDIIWYRAWLFEDDGRYERARARYQTIFNGHPQSAKADEARFRHALCHIKEDNHAAALTALEQFVQKRPQSSWRSAALYWQSRCLMALHRNAEAARILRGIRQSDPLGYYAYRSQEMLIILGERPDLLMLDTTRTTSRLLQWLEGLGGSAGAAVDSSALRRGTLLALSGLTQQADMVLEPLESRHSGNNRLMFQIATLYAQCGIVAPSFKIARRIYGRAPAARRDSVPYPMYLLTFPCPYQKVMLEHCSRFEVSPYLVKAVMRQESIFDHRIVSPVGAIGLMQIMPYTGKEIADDLREPFIPDSLYSPGLNIRYGTYYLSKLLKQFKGNLILAIASYNAGPHNARRWYKINKDDDFDTFIEDIGFAETRNYVKKVLANYWTYQYLSAFDGFCCCPD